MEILLANKSGIRSGRKLAEGLGLVCRKTPKAGDTIVIRWGSSVNIAWPLDKCINNPIAIRLAAHGINSLKVMRDADINSLEVLNASDLVYPVIGRNKINHRAGTDATFIASEDLFVKCLYYTKYVPLRTEFRAHVIGTEVVKLLRKVKREEDADDKIRTSVRGWGFFRVDHKNNYKKVQAEAVRALNALGLFFGGVDCGYDTNGKSVIIEVNTAPALNSDTLQVYIRGLSDVK